MRIAIPYENGNIFQHFGRSEAFKFYDVDGGAVTATAVVSTNGSGHGALAGFLVAHHADAVICGGIGGGAHHVGPGPQGLIGRHPVLRRRERQRGRGSAGAA